VGSADSASDGPQPNPFNSYTDADVYLRYRIAPFAIATIRLNDLGNERYEPIYGYPAPGRTIFFELATR
jgi:outer membrane cobalamin receptor